tara:strand:- start:1521 stop:1661 length:141 start_codon:yes stop_codon:yes gene_type:complete
MGCINSIPISASINDEIREIEHSAYNNSRITNEQNNKSIIYKNGYK